MTMTVGDRVRWARGRRGLTLKQLGDAADVHWVTIQKMESGTYGRPPRAGTVRLLALALNVDETWLATGAGTPGGGLPMPDE